MSQRQAAFAYFNRAAKLYRQVCYAQAVKYYLAGLEIDPMCVEAHADLAKAYEMLGCWNRAIESLEVALRLRPGYPTALRRKQRILEEKSVYEALADELELVLNAADRHQLTNVVQVEPSRSGGGISKIEHEYFTLTGGRAIPQKLLAIISQLLEHTYQEVGKVFQCYPQHKVLVFIEAANQADTSEVITHTPSVGTSLPQWAVACYENGSIRLTYRPDSDSSIGVLYAVVRHEWTHLLLDLLTEGRCPNWLDEGLAQFIARPLMNSEKAFLQQASRNGHLLPLYLLQKPFRHLSTKQRRLAYLQSYAIVKYLIQEFNFSTLHDFLKHVGDGKLTDIAFQEIFGKTAAEIIRASSANNYLAL